MPEATAGRAAGNLLDFQLLADRDRANIGRLEQRLGADAVVEVPLLEHDVHDLEGLAAVSRHLFAELTWRESCIAGKPRVFSADASSIDRSPSCDLPSS